jgi:hypothetical protein
MARNLLYEAQATAQAQVAPQFAALQEALATARADRDSAIRTAAVASRGLGRAINRAGPSIKAAYKTGKLAAAGAKYGSADYAQVARNEQAVTGTALASSRANALKELSDRRIEAAAGRAFRTQKALSDYQSAAATIATRRQSVAAQYGALTASAYSKLAEAQAQRDFQAQMKASEQAFSAHQNALSRRQQELTREAESSRQASTQAFQAHQNALGRRASRRNLVYTQKQQNQRTAKTSSAPTKTQIARTDVYLKTIQAYKADQAKNRPLSQTTREAVKAGVPQAVANAAAEYAKRGHIAPTTADNLRAFGIVVPKSQVGVPIRAHTRRRRTGRGLGGPYGTGRIGR